MMECGHHRPEAGTTATSLGEGLGVAEVRGNFTQVSTCIQTVTEKNRHGHFCDKIGTN